MIEAEIDERAYRIGGGWLAFRDPGEYGPLSCGCCIVVIEVDRVGPRL